MKLIDGEISLFEKSEKWVMGFFCFWWKFNIYEFNELNGYVKDRFENEFLIYSGVDILNIYSFVKDSENSFFYLLLDLMLKNLCFGEEIMLEFKEKYGF